MLEEWSARTFGKEYAEEIADIKTVYYICCSGKPEHIDKIDFHRKK